MSEGCIAIMTTDGFARAYGRADERPYFPAPSVCLPFHRSSICSPCGWLKLPQASEQICYGRLIRVDLQRFFQHGYGFIPHSYIALSCRSPLFDQALRSRVQRRVVLWIKFKRIPECSDGIVCPPLASSNGYPLRAA